MDRRALLVGCWENLRPPSPQRTRGVIERLSKALGGPLISCKSLDGESDEPTKLLNPSQADILQQIENVSKRPSEDTELFFYYMGHSVPAADNSLSISLGERSQVLNSPKNDTEIEMRPVRLNRILDELADRGFRRIIGVFDTCHSGLAVNVMGSAFQAYVVMTSTGNAYSYNAEFSDALIWTLERPLQPKDQRVDKSVRAITFNRLFQVAKARLPAERPGTKEYQPAIAGPMANDVVLEVPLEIPKRYNTLAYKRSIYHRTHEIIKIIEQEELDAKTLTLRIATSSSFILDRSSKRSVSGDRIAEYLNFLQKSGLVEDKNGRLILSPTGKAAAGLFFNQTLLDVIETQLFPDELTYDLLEEAIHDLINDRLNATPAALAERLRMKGSSLPLTDANRFALKLLPSTRRFGKGSSDALHVVSEY